MRHLLRNDNKYTVSVEYRPDRDVFRTEVYAGMDWVTVQDLNTPQQALELAGRFVEHHIPSRFLWALVMDRDNPPARLPQTATLKAENARKVEALYGKKAA